MFMWYISKQIDFKQNFKLWTHDNLQIITRKDNILKKIPNIPTIHGEAAKKLKKLNGPEYPEYPMEKRVYILYLNSNYQKHELWV